MVHPVCTPKAFEFASSAENQDVHSITAGYPFTQTSHSPACDVCVHEKGKRSITKEMLVLVWTSMLLHHVLQLSVQTSAFLKTWPLCVVSVGPTLCPMYALFFTQGILNVI